MKRLASRSTWWRTLPHKSTHAVNLSPLDEAQTKELAAGVERAVAALPPKEAQVISPRVRGQLEAAALSRLARGRLANSRNRVIDA